MPDASGSFDKEQRLAAAEAWGESASLRSPRVSARLLELVYRAAEHFGAPYVWMISGYRSDANGGSRHRDGSAIDFVLPGVSDRRLAAYLQQQGFVGVGLYPRSGFVHLDIRSRSYFWTDNSSPGQGQRRRVRNMALASKYDALARRRGVTPEPEALSTEEQTQLPSEAEAVEAPLPIVESPPPAATDAEMQPLP